MTDSEKAVTKLTKRQLLAIFGGAIGATAITGASNSLDGDGDADTPGGTMQAGGANMAGLNKVGDQLWKGPLSVRGDVPENDGNDFIATDAGSNNDLFELYHYSGGSWSRQGFKLKEVMLVDQA